MITSAPLSFKSTAAEIVALQASLKMAVERVRLANLDGNPILSAWLQEAEALLRTPRSSKEGLADQVRIQTGEDEESQMSAFANGTLQSLGQRHATTIQTFISVPSEMDKATEQELASYVQAVLEDAALSTGRKLAFDVQIGPSLDAMKQ